jgi:hypothetical protein
MTCQLQNVTLINLMLLLMANYFFLLLVHTCLILSLNSSGIIDQYSNEVLVSKAILLQLINAALVYFVHTTLQLQF